MTLSVTILLALVCGAGIGVLAGMLGIGGGMLMIPLFQLVFGLSPAMCSGTSLLAVILTSLAGSTTHLRNKTASFQIGIITGVTGAFFSVLGATVTGWVPGWVITLTAVLIMSYVAVTSLNKSYRLFKKDKAAAKTAGDEKRSEGAQTQEMALEIAEEMSDSSWNRFLYKGSVPKTVGLSIFVGAIAGFFAGFVGVGGGFIMIPCFTRLFGMEMKQASGTSLVSILVIAIAGSIRQATLGNIAFFPALFMGGAAIPGAIFGANVINKLPEKYARLIFAGVLAVSISSLLLKLFGVV